MSMWKWVAIGAGVLALAGSAVLYTAFGAFLPWREEDEIRRLGQLAALRPGMRVAEIGAGRGRFAEGLARMVEPGGVVYASEISPARLADLRERAVRLTNVRVVEATTTATNLPHQCCDVVLMRAMYHHVGDPATFVRAVEQLLRPGGRVIVIDFDPSTLWFHGARPDGSSERRTGHGVSQRDVAAEFTDAGFSVDREIPRWSGPLWLTSFSKPNILTSAWPGQTVSSSLEPVPSEGGRR